MKALFFFCFSISACLLFAQSNPTPFDLNTGNYSLSSWDSTSAAGTYPVSMVFHTFNTGNTDANTPAVADWICGYNLSSRPRFIGRNTDGIAFLNTGNSQFATCAANGDTTNVFVGDVTLSLNTIGRDNIQLSWVGRMLSNFNYNDTGSVPVNRFFGITCQYRIGTSNSFTTMPIDSTFFCQLNDSTYHPEFYADTLGPILLPDTLENQAVVEIRWIYHRTNSGQGPRPELAVDDITITSDLVTGFGHNKKSSSFVKNTLSGEEGIHLKTPGSYEVRDCTGRLISRVEKTAYISTTSLPSGLYFVTSLQNGATERVLVRP